MSNRSREIFGIGDCLWVGPNMAPIIFSVICTLFVVFLTFTFVVQYWSKARIHDVKSKVVLITGCDSGFGQAFLERFNGAGKQGRFYGHVHWTRVHVHVTSSEIRQALQLNCSWYGRLFQILPFLLASCFKEALIWRKRHIAIISFQYYLTSQAGSRCPHCVTPLISLSRTTPTKVRRNSAKQLCKRQFKLTSHSTNWPDSGCSACIHV